MELKRRFKNLFVLLVLFETKLQTHFQLTVVFNCISYSYTQVKPYVTYLYTKKNNSIKFITFYKKSS